MQRLRKVLVVDDHKDSAEALSLWIELEGCEVKVAHRGADAVAVAQEFTPTLALLDLMMPDMTGWELAPLIRQASPECMIVALTGLTTQPDVSRSRAAGFDAHLFKPLTVDALTGLLLAHPR